MLRSSEEAGAHALDRRKWRKPGFGAMRLTVGVTGHRDLVAAEVPALKDAVRDFFRYLKQTFPDLRLQMINPLAEGSDRLAADIALEMGVDLIVPLPMPQAEYEKDFSDTRSVGAFRATLQKAHVIQLRAGPEVEESSGQTSRRDRLYAQLGVFISNHSQILLAIWDGKESDSPGGTGAVVQYHMTGVMPGYLPGEESPNLLADNENDLAFHIVVSRDRPDGQPREGMQPLHTSWVTAHYGRASGDPMPREYQVMLHRLQDFGLDMQRYDHEIERGGVDILADLPAAEIPPGIKDAARVYGASDWLALHFQKRVSAGLLAVHTIAGMMGLAFIVYSEYDSLNFLVTLFLVFFLTGFVIYKIGERRQWHRKYLDYRALAEGLRVQVYWNLAGVIDARATEFTYDNFLQKQDVDLGWIRHVMRNASLLKDRSARPPAMWLDWVVEQWVGQETKGCGQLRYYRRKELEKIKHFKRTELLGRLTLWAGILLAAAMAVRGSGMPESQRHIVFVLMGILPLIAGIRDAYSHKKAEKELIKQYRFMHGIFGNAKRLLDASDDVAFRRRVLRALGDAALEESAEWILMHRERPLEHSGLQ